MNPATQSNPRYLIIRAPTQHKLVLDMDLKLADNVWECVGAPFYDSQRLEWCQAIARRDRPERSGEVRLKEPRR